MAVGNGPEEFLTRFLLALSRRVWARTDETASRSIAGRRYVGRTTPTSDETPDPRDIALEQATPEQVEQLEAASDEED